ncbi:cytochrome c oxidase assembly protein COX18, mitochondrial-like [Dendronephthya gigantea]|uniref:cytochrome c oxidase assembly protein COX18, mitochondrial-like n=1 Tax=Dendronephthya gigantea TaxID=151771 RepID=UPI00106C1794|nr:cytochrome c oxidase assembly protein COX18, mitochondrial-like [Dendronephthya gigantea]XP_028410882.1 cytochrome c oxidase assembly protein COX18, mitochondrial-like [Dendronephthya gigantea]
MLKTMKTIPMLRVRYSKCRLNKVASAYIPQFTPRRNLTETTAAENTSDYLPISIAQNFLETVHDYTHLPWWCTIVVTCIGLRSVITLPLAVHQNKLLTKIELLQPTLKELTEALKHRVTIECRNKGMSSQAANNIFKRKLRKYTYNLYSTNGCNPIKLYTLPWAQIPLWIILSLALRNLSGTFRWDSKGENPFPPHPDMSKEGTLWFSDLTVPDYTGILPVFLGIANLANIELHSLKKKNPALKQRTITMLFRLLSLCMIAVALKVPAAMSLYWSASAGFGLLQNISLKFPRVRRILRIPKTPSESAMPFKDIASIIAGRAKKFLEIQRENMKKK